MDSHGIIYQAGKTKLPAEFVFRPKPIIRLFYHLARGVGAGLIAFAMVGLLFSFWPILKEEFLFRGSPTRPASGFGELLAKSQASYLGLDPYFSLNIPKIGAKAKIIPNVDAGNFAEYSQALKQGVAHARGTNFPGQGKTIYLFSHSTDSPLNFNRYNAVFYLLRKLEPGDRIAVYFLDKNYFYRVSEKIITAANDTSWLRDDGSGLPAGRQGERLILQTCDPPGTTLRRLLIVARPI